jgi:hypothetical protein
MVLAYQRRRSPSKPRPRTSYVNMQNGKTYVTSFKGDGYDE